MQFFDLWDVETYPQSVEQLLGESEQYVREFYESGLYPASAIRWRYDNLLESLKIILSDYAVRAWHYTKLCQFEVDKIKTHGTEISTEEFLKIRLNDLVLGGFINRQIADTISEKNCMQSEKNDFHSDRIGNFHLITEPELPFNVGDITRYWGGESAYVGQHQGVTDILKNIGKSCVIEVALPMNICRVHQPSYFADEVISFYAAKNGFRSKPTCFQLFIQEKIPAQNILHIHQEDSDEFSRIGSGYPANYPIK